MEWSRPDLIRIGAQLEGVIDGYPVARETILVQIKSECRLLNEWLLYMQVFLVIRFHVFVGSDPLSWIESGSSY